MQPPRHKGILIILLGLGACEFLAGQSITSAAREGVNMGSFSATEPYSRSSVSPYVPRETGRRLGRPMGDYQERYLWNDRDLAYMSKDRVIRFSGRLSAGWWYDDNINLSEGGAQNKKVGDSYYNLRPSLDLSISPSDSGLTVAVSYDTDFQWYLGKTVHDIFNQNVGLNVNYDRGGKLRSYLTTTYASIDGGNVDVGDRVQQNIWLLAAGLQYDFTGKLTGGVGFSKELLDYSGHYFPSDSYNTSAYFDYAIGAKTKIGLGANFDYTDVEGGSDYRSYELNFRFSWAPTARLSFNSTFGAMYLESTAGGFSQTTPVATLNLNYDIFGTGKTSATLGVSRSFQPSAVLVNESYFSNDVVLNITQHMTERLQFSLGLGYEFADYQATAARINASREDNFYFIRPTLTYAICRSLSSSLFYQFSKDDSTGFGSSSFERNAAGVMVNYAF